MSLPLILTLQQDLALRLLTLEVSGFVGGGAGADSPAETVTATIGEEAASDLRQFLWQAFLSSGESDLVGGLLRVCRDCGLPVASFLPTAFVEEVTEAFNAWGSSLSPPIDLPTLYSVFPGAAHAVVQWAAGRQEAGLDSLDTYAAFLEARGADLASLVIEADYHREEAAELLVLIHKAIAHGVMRPN